MAGRLQGNANRLLEASQAVCEGSDENCGQLTTSAAIQIRPSQGEP